MEWAVEESLQYAEIKERLRKTILTFPVPDLPPGLKEIVDWQPLTRQQRNRINRYFDEKVDYLLEDGQIARPLVAPLKHLHLYRNDAYHRGRLRPKTLALSCRLYLEINCDLALSLRLGGHSFSSGEDSSWLEQRSSVKLAGALGYSNLRDNAIARYRESVNPGSGLAEALAGHLEARISDLRDALVFVVENTNYFSSPEHVFHECQYFALPERAGIDRFAPPPPTYRPPYDLSVLDELLTELPRITSSASQLEAFAAYSTLEAILEQFEGSVEATVSEVDRGIQLAIDIARGK